MTEDHVAAVALFKERDKAVKEPTLCVLCLYMGGRYGPFHFGSLLSVTPRCECSCHEGVVL